MLLILRYRSISSCVVRIVPEQRCVKLDPENDKMPLWSIFHSISSYLLESIFKILTLLGLPSIAEFDQN